MSRLEIVQELEQEYKIELVPYFQLYEALKNNARLRFERKISRQKAIEKIAKFWNMSIDLATESYDLAHERI